MCMNVWAKRSTPLKSGARGSMAKKCPDDIYLKSKGWAWNRRFRMKSAVETRADRRETGACAQSTASIPDSRWIHAMRQRRFRAQVACRRRRAPASGERRSGSVRRRRADLLPAFRACVSCDATCTPLLSAVTRFMAKSRIEKGIVPYPHKLWISLCMSLRGMGRRLENQGFSKVWRKKRHALDFH